MNGERLTDSGSRVGTGPTSGQIPTQTWNWTRVNSELSEHSLELVYTKIRDFAPLTDLEIEYESKLKLKDYKRYIYKEILRQYTHSHACFINISKCWLDFNERPVSTRPRATGSQGDCATATRPCDSVQGHVHVWSSLIRRSKGPAWKFLIFCLFYKFFDEKLSQGAPARILAGMSQIWNDRA